MIKAMAEITYENCEFIDEVTNFFPLNQVMNPQEDNDEYLLDLIKVVKDNYILGNYQVAYFNSHLIFMCYIYSIIDLIFKHEPVRCLDIYSAIKAYNRSEKPKIENCSCFYHYSIIAEKDIFAMLRAIGMEEQSINNLAEYVNKRNDCAHATGKRDILTETIFTDRFNNLIKIIKNIQAFLNKYLAKKHIDFLLDNYTCDYSDLEAIFEDYLEADSLSINNLNIISNLGLSNYRNYNEKFTENYRNIKNIHCAFVEYCVNNFEIDINDCCREWIEKDYYCFFKYKDNPDRYIEDVLDLNSYQHIKDGGEWPLYNCPECDIEQLVYDGEKERFLCFNCDNVWGADKISFCDSCGQPYFDNGCEEIQKCYNCIQYILEKD